jgi:hypothetical protein
MYHISDMIGRLFKYEGFKSVKTDEFICIILSISKTPFLSI